MDKVITPLKQIINKINTIKLQKQSCVQLLAVSKRRDKDQILKLYEEGQRNFGENYVPELEEKSTLLPSDINWFMIGHLQSNKAKKVLSIKNLTTIASVDSIKLANEINKQCVNLNRNVNIYIQTNISEEKTKSGCDVNKVVDLYSEISTKCKNINVLGVMSLGTLHSKEEFDKMYNLKLKIMEKEKKKEEEIELSFGTSADYELAIECGATQVRVGSVLFVDTKKTKTDDNIENITNEKI